QNLLRSACRRRARDARRFVPVTGDSTLAASSTGTNRRASRARRVVPVELGAKVESPVAADGEAEYQDLVGAIERASEATLSPKLRDCVLARLRDLGPAEIAAEQGANPATLRARLRLARARLGSGASAVLDREGANL